MLAVVSTYLILEVLRTQILNRIDLEFVYIKIMIVTCLIIRLTREVQFP